MCKNTLLKIAAPILLLIVLSPMIISTHQTEAYAVSCWTCVYLKAVDILGITLGKGWFEWQFFFCVPSDTFNHVHYTYGAAAYFPGVSACAKYPNGLVNHQCLIGSVYIAIHTWVNCVSGVIYNCLFYKCTINGQPIICFRYGLDSGNNVQYYTVPITIEVPACD